MELGPDIHIKRALLSAHEPHLILPLAKTLSSLGAELWATSGTKTVLTAEGLVVRSTEELTGIGSWFSGRVKTLHPAIFGGILAPRDAAGVTEMNEREVVPFDLVAVHLYPFEEALASGTTDSHKLTELIDIGGVSLIRAAAKNFQWVVPVPSAGAALAVANELQGSRGAVKYATRRSLAAETFTKTAKYDDAISTSLSSGSAAAGGASAQDLRFHLTDSRLRYGENPHQKAWVYSIAGAQTSLRPWPLRVVKGEALSYNNYLDIDNSLTVVAQFEKPSAAVVKHATPCGVASGDTAAKALAAALETDAVARYGCVIALNRPVTEEVVDALKGTFVDLIVAPGFDIPSIERLRKRPKVKGVTYQGHLTREFGATRLEARTAGGALLVEECDQRVLDADALRQVSKRKGTPEEIASMLFAWRVVRHVRSNAIVLSKGEQTVGIGGGQTSRVGAVKSAIEVAGDRAQGAVMASDAFFPFRDSVVQAGEAGVRAILHPGGSIRDAEVTETADACDMAMYTTGWRVFRH